MIASQLGHRDLRMTKRYARIAAAQVKQAVSGLDAVLLPASEAEKPALSHPIVTKPGEAKEANEESSLESWRPRRDLNPCYRRERALPYRNLLKRCDADGYRRHVQ